MTEEQMTNSILDTASKNIQKVKDLEAIIEKQRSALQEIQEPLTVNNPDHQYIIDYLRNTARDALALTVQKDDESNAK